MCQWGPGLPATRAARTRPDARCSGQAPGEAWSLWGVRSHAHWWLGECGDRSRHGPRCGCLPPALVGADGQGGVSAGPRPPHHGRWGGSNARRKRLWKVARQQLADESGLALSVRHCPPGTSTWQKLAHRMFGHMTEHWRGRPVISHEGVVHCIGHPTTNTGLIIQAALDKNASPTGIKVSREDMKQLHLSPAQFHGKDWNYAIKPRQQRS